LGLAAARMCVISAGTAPDPVPQHFAAPCMIGAASLGRYFWTGAQRVGARNGRHRTLWVS